MPHFQNLQNVLDMDFSQMRALKTEGGGRRASDAAIQSFVTNLAVFYQQFNEIPPTNEELATYREYMEKITNRIDESEYAYYLDKYTNEYPEDAEQMAQSSKLKPSGGISTRMQYWAAAEKFGGTIRNAKVHKFVVSKLDEWSKLLTAPRPDAFFQPEKQPEDKESKDNHTPKI